MADNSNMKTYKRHRNSNNRVELSYQPTRLRKQVMSHFKSINQAQRLLETHAAVYNLFNLGRHRTNASHYRVLRKNALAEWNNVVA